ncbi:hypothetical protein HY995_00865 [Candidatus Micrarchaeota archaeon]|nr:hypothetical protein [Candidatus Micrarchaeota archaeon]MBI5176619.1 hypothetical protein [Candidatus Micrarchaeota archaeon]
MAPNRKVENSGQGLVILGAVLLALIAVLGALGYAPDFGTPSKERQSAEYWSSASPLTITDAHAAGNAVSMTVANRLYSTAVTLDSISFDGAEISNTPVQFQPRERKTLQAQAIIACLPKSARFQISNVTLAYRAEGGKETAEEGARPLFGDC